MEKWLQKCRLLVTLGISVGLIGCTSKNLSNHISLATVSTVSNESNLKSLREFNQNASFDLRAVSLDQALEIAVRASGYRLKLSAKIANDRYLAMRMIDKPLWLTTEAILQGNCLSAQVQNEQTLFIYPNPNQTACLPSKFPNISADTVSSVPISASINDMTTIDALVMLFSSMDKNFVASITAIKPSRVTGVWNDQKAGLIFQQITQASCYNYKLMSPDVWLISDKFAPKNCQINPKPTETKFKSS